MQRNADTRPFAGYCKGTLRKQYFAPAFPLCPDLKKGVRVVKVCENDNPSMHSPAVKASKSATSLALKQKPVTGRNCCSAASYCRPDPERAVTRYRAGTGDWKQLRHSRGRRQMASQPGATTVEAVRFVDLTDLVRV